MRKAISFRVDANHQLGFGHAVRCIAIAEEAVNRDWKADFIMAGECPGQIASQLHRLGTVTKLPSASLPGSAADAEFSVSKLAADKTAITVLDGYQFDSNYQKLLRRPEYSLLVIDDYHHLEQYHADYISCPSPLASPDDYRADQTVQFLLGPEYILIRKVFQEERKKHGLATRGEIKRLLVTLGGAAPTELWKQLVSALLDRKSDTFEIVLLGFRGAREEIAPTGAARIRIIPHVDNPAPIMASADAAIVAGGVSAWELAALGIPFLVVSIAKNQTAVSKWMDDKIGIFLGESEKFNRKDFEFKFGQFAADAALRERLASGGWNCVDGLGPSRILDACIRNLK